MSNKNVDHDIEVEEKIVMPPMGPESDDTKTPRNFRHNPDVENFYRFVSINGLRKEVKMILELFLGKVKGGKKRRRKHLQ